MSDFKLVTPVAFFIFNRPDRAGRVFEMIKKARPTKLLVIADGPRENRLNESQACEETREIIRQVDWDCEVLTNFSDVNLGCKLRISSGLDWVFANVEEAIILEDDCVPVLSFFRFCQELLEKYREDERISLISGDNFQFGCEVTNYSYYFSKCVHIWGWATWRRAWAKYDIKMSEWDKIDQRAFLMDILHNRYRCEKWERIFNNTAAGNINTWDYQWVFTTWMQNGLSIVPQKNLVSNIGFGESATHTTGSSRYAEMPTFELDFPLTDPPYVFRNLDADLFELQQEYRLSRIKRILSKFNPEER